MPHGIKSAAIKTVRKTYTLPPPARHVDIEKVVKDSGDTGGTKGFVSDAGKFLTRKEAAKVAKVKNMVVPGMLHSEDVW